MSGPYINNGNYVFGVNEYHQPCLPKYNSTLHHKKHGIREIPNDGIRDDGVPYTSYYSEPDYCATCNRCDRIVRDSLMTNIINIESSVTKILTIKLYGITEDLDKEVNLRVGNKYCISYVTEDGIKTVTGTFREFSPNLPDECVRYIGNFNTSLAAAYIGLDCSTDGKSDKRLIYIASIRFIEEIIDDSVDQYPDMTQEEKMRALTSAISSTLTNINNYIAEQKAKEEEESSSEDTSGDDGDTETTPTVAPAPPAGRPPLPPVMDGVHAPPPYPNPFIPYGFYPYNGGPLIVETRYVVPPYPPYKPPVDVPPGTSEEDIKDSITSDTVIEALTAVQAMINSFIMEYEADQEAANGCPPCCPWKDKNKPEETTPTEEESTEDPTTDPENTNDDQSSTDNPDTNQDDTTDDTTNNDNDNG